MQNSVVPGENRDKTSIIHNTLEQKQPKCPSADEQINKMWHIHIAI